MSEEHKKVYMLLELEKIKELNIPHLYVFPTSLLEFSCILFKGPAYVVFKLVKPGIEDGWCVTIRDSIDDPGFRGIEEMKPKPCSACEVLLEIVAVADKCTNVKIVKRGEEAFPFIFKDISNRKRNITALLSFIDGRCAKNNQ